MLRLCVVALLGAIVLAEKALDTLSPAEVQQWLKDLHIEKAFGESFAKFQVDGEILEDIALTDDFEKADFPNARKFHWRKLRRTVEQAMHRRLQAKGKTPAPKKGAAPAKKSFVDYIGVRVKHDKGVLSFGTKSDTVLYREKPATFGVQGNLNVHGSLMMNGKSVGDTLKGLASDIKKLGGGGGSGGSGGSGGGGAKPGKSDGTVDHSKVSFPATLKKGLIVWYSFDEKSGDDTLYDSYPGGKYWGDPVKKGAVKSSTGVLGRARVFNGIHGSGSCITLHNRKAWQMGTQDFTMSFWVKKSSKTKHQRPWSKSGGWSGKYDGYGFQYSDFKPYFRVQSDDGAAGGHEYTTSGVAAPTNTWYHLTATIQRKGRMRLYINGVEKSSYDMSKYYKGSLDSWNSMTFGCVHNHNQNGKTAMKNYVEYWSGAVDEAGMWNRVLSVSEIKMIYNGGKGITYPVDGSKVVPKHNLMNGLNAYWDFEDSDVKKARAVFPGGSKYTGTSLGGKLEHTSGPRGKARRFFGSSKSCINLGNILNRGKSDFSMSIWLSTVGSHNRPWSKAGGWGSAVDGYGFQFDGKKSYFRIQVGNDKAEVTTHDGADAHAHTAAWTMLTVTVDRDGFMTLYADGQLKSHLDISSLKAFEMDSDKPMSFGCVNNGGWVEYWNGAIDEAAAWSRVLTAHEIMVLYMDGEGTFYNQASKKFEFPGIYNRNPMIYSKPVPGFPTALQKKLIVWYSFDETKGDSTLYDSYPGGEYWGDTIKKGAVGVTNGKRGKARVFSGSQGSCITVHNRDAWQVGTEDFSMAFWVYKSSKTKHQRPWSKSGGWSGDYDGYGFQYSDFNPYFRIQSDDGSSGSHEYTTSAFGAPTNTWYHLTATVNRKGRMRVYYNGVEKKSYDLSKYAGASLDSWNSMTFGCVHNHNQNGKSSLKNYVEHWSGAVDEAGMWGRVLSPSEVKMVYNGGKGITYPVDGSKIAPKHDLMKGLDAYWDFEDSDVKVARASYPGDGTFRGTSLGGKITSQSGPRGKARRFYGSTKSCINLGNVLNRGLQDFSMNIWLSTHGSNNRPWSKAGGWGSAVDGYGFQFDGKRSYFRIQVGNDKAEVTTNDGADAHRHTTAWTMLTVTVDRDGFMTLYSDGQMKSHLNIRGLAGYEMDSDKPMSFGCVHNGGWVEFWNGAIDEAAAWSRVLTAHEIMVLYMDGEGMFYNSKTKKFQMK